jgi:hypothetical protein
MQPRLAVEPLTILLAGFLVEVQRRSRRRGPPDSGPVSVRSLRGIQGRVPARARDGRR